MFESVELKEFGGVRSCKKPIKLNRFTVLIGPNDSAKTTLLNALFLFPCPWAGYNLPIIDIDKRTVLHDFLHRTDQSLVYRYSGRGQINCILEGKPLKLEVNDRGPSWYYAEEQKIEGSEILKISELLGIEADIIRSYTLFIPDSDTFRKKIADALRSNWDTVEKTGAHTRLVRELISKVVEDRFTEVSVKFNDLVLRKELPQNDVAYIRIDHVGDGVKRFLTGALWLETVKPKVVLWDDLESAAHPSLIKEIIEWLANHRWQTIISTHSIDVLRELMLAEPEGAIIIALRKLADDSLEYKEYTLEELGQMFESGQDVRKLLV
jgi:predicted ATPase